MGNKYYTPGFDIPSTYEVHTGCTYNIFIMGLSCIDRSLCSIP